MKMKLDPLWLAIALLWSISAAGALALPFAH
jgi:hypothetical protein